MNENYTKNPTIGCDIEEVSRFEKYCNFNNIDKTPPHKHKFLEKIYTENEIKYCFSNTLNNFNNQNPKIPISKLQRERISQKLAARFCAKEAVFKAINTMFPKEKISLKLKDIEVLNNDNKIPSIKINSKNKFFDTLSISISLSHTKKQAMAAALVYKF